jgi:hypothetical protein
MATAQPPLDYAPPPAWHRRRVVRRIALVVLLLAAAYPAVRIGSPLARRWRLSWLYDRCANYAAAPTQVVYASESAAARALVAGQGGYVAHTSPAGGTVALHVPGVLVELARRALPANPSVARDLAAGAAGATVFLHERRTPSGESRLVVVQRPAEGSFPPAQMQLIAYVAKRPTFDAGTFQLPVVAPLIYSAGSLPEGLLGFPPRVGVRAPRLKYFAGQADPVDPSRFTIAFEIDGSPGVIDGRLKDDNTVEFTSPSQGSTGRQEGKSAISGTVDLSSATAPMNLVINDLSFSAGSAAFDVSADFQIEKPPPTSATSTQPAASRPSRN